MAGTESMDVARDSLEPASIRPRGSAQRSALEAVPVTVIAGFLGAGKTTYINRRLAAGDVVDALILVNDVGKVNVDVASIDYRDDRVLSLANGCVCCTLGGTLAEQLSQALRLKARPSEILIEASGVANPWRIGDIARLAPGLSLSDTVVLVDASQARRLAQDVQVSDLWHAQLSSARRLLVNRLPRDEEDRERLLAWLGKLAPGATLVSETGAWDDGDVAAQSCGGADSQLDRTIAGSSEHPAGADASGGHTDHSGLRQRTLHFTGAVAADRLVMVLERYRDCLYRAKGFLRQAGGEGGWYSLQYSGSRGRWHPHGRPVTGAVLVCIGRQSEPFDGLIKEIEQLEEPLEHLIDHP